MYEKSRGHRPWWCGQPLLDWVGYLLIAWDQALHWGKKEKKICERSKVRCSLGRGKGRTHFLPFSPAAEPVPGYLRMDLHDGVTSWFSFRCHNYYLYVYNAWPCKSVVLFMVFSVFTVTPSKIKMQTIQYRRSRIWEMKEDQYTNILAKN